MVGINQFVIKEFIFVLHVHLLFTGTAFTVLWQNVSLQDKPKDGQFTFQATLHKNGDIVFVYQNVPSIVIEIQESNHPTKIGLSDAYIMDHDDFCTFTFTHLRCSILSPQSLCCIRLSYII